MIIRKMSFLDQETRGQIEALVGICNESDGTHGEIKLDNSIQYYPEMNNLFLMFEENSLICVIKLFSIFRESVELSGYTHPAHRNSGVFKLLLKEVFQEVRAYGYKELLYVIDTGSINGLDWTDRKNLAYQSTEVTMRLVNYSRHKKGDQGVFVKKVEEIELPVLIGLHQELFGLPEEDAEKYLKKVMNFGLKDFFLMMNEEALIGLGGIYRDEEKAILFGIGIRQRFRGKGFSKILLGELVDIARSQGSYDIELEVDQENHKAYNLYKNIGFVESYSMSYYREIL